MIEIEDGSGNVYADLAFADADKMLLKAQLAEQIRDIIHARQWSKKEACERLDLSQLKLSNLLNGKFRGVSETEMRGYLDRLEPNNARS